MKCFQYLFQFLITAGIFFSSATVSSQNLTPKEFDSLLIYNHYWVIQNKSFDEVITWNRKLMKQAEKQNYPKGIVWGHLNIANRYYNYGRFNESLKELDAAEKIAEKNVIDNNTSATIYGYYSVVYKMMKLYDLGLKYNDKAVFYGKKIEDSPERRRNYLLNYIYNERAYLFYGKNNNDSAVVYLYKSNKEFENPAGYACIALHYLEHRPNQDSAYVNLEKAMVYVKRNDNYATNQVKSLIYCGYGHYYLNQGNKEKAREYLEKSLEFGLKKKNVDRLVKIYKLLNETYQGLGQPEKEKLYLEKYIFLKDSLENSQTKGIELSIKKIEEEKNKEKKTLKKTTFLYSSIAGFLSLLLFTYLYYQNKKKKRLIVENKKIISQKEDETSELKSRIVDAHEEIMQLAKNNDIGFFAKFQEVYPNVFKKLLELNPELTQANLIFCALIWLGFSSKDIAEFTFMQHRSVQIKKSRLRKKLNLGPDVDLYQFLKSLVEN
ncbi:tetratricopeptide repeat protein [Chryseobacterium sp. SIMBA_029]|uniref:tetratricopeptide repeat protein n=3 Tax=Pseudomonadati TaxID=3379134 RepID=UPI003978B6D0